MLCFVHLVKWLLFSLLVLASMKTNLSLILTWRYSSYSGRDRYNNSIASSFSFSSQHTPLSASFLYPSLSSSLSSSHFSQSQLFHQVEVDLGNFVPDFSNSVLVHRNAIEELNTQIKVCQLVNFLFALNSPCICLIPTFISFPGVCHQQYQAFLPQCMWLASITLVSCPNPRPPPRA